MSPFNRHQPEGPAPRILELTSTEIRYAHLSIGFRDIASTLAFICVFCSDIKESDTYETSSIQLERQAWGKRMMGVLTGSPLGHEGELFGFQRHGLAVVSDFLLEPSLLTSKAFVFHIQRGQLLDVPLKNGKIFEGKFTRIHRVVLKSADLLLNSFSDMGKSEACEWLRWDVEPCWETDPQTCCVCFRIGGIPRFYLGLAELVETIDIDGRNTVICKGCSHDETTDTQVVDTFHRRPWLQLPFIDMVKRGQLAVTDVEGLTSPPGPNWIAKVGESDMLAMLAFICRFGRGIGPELRLSTDCVVAGIQRAAKLGYPEKSVLLIVRSSKINQNS